MIEHLTFTPDFPRAACRQLDPQTADEYFMPKRYESAAAKMARRICNNCVIVEDCRNFAVATQQEHGIWGGTDPNQRRAYAMQEQEDDRCPICGAHISEPHNPECPNNPEQWEDEE